MRSIIRQLGRLLPLACLFAVPVHAAPAAHVPDTIKQRVQGCAECHGEQGQGGANGYYPRLAGKPADYLFHQLVDFRDGRRQFPPMEWMVRPLGDTYLHEIASYFASRKAPAYQPRHVPQLSPTQMARGRQLVMHGDPAHKLPACASCHGKTLDGVEPSVPGLLGLQYDYISAQIGAWRAGTRRARAPDCMAAIASRLTPDDVSAVSAWLASQPASDAARPAPAGSVTMPMTCGGEEH